MWSNRLSWSGEIPYDFPGLNPIAAQRFNTDGPVWSDSVDPAHEWVADPWGGTSAEVVPGPWGNRCGLNINNPAVERSTLSLPYFEGLWPSSGKLLMALRVKQSYTMTFNPLMSTRGGPDAPIAYLSTYTTGRLRHQVYAENGSVVLDQYEDAPWGGQVAWQWIAQLVDLDNQTSQIVAVNLDTRQVFLSPVRSLSGPPNASCESPLEVFGLPNAGYWSGGELDEILVAHPTAAFDLAELAEKVRLGAWAKGQDPLAAQSLMVTDEAVVAASPGVLHTGAEPASWGTAPIPSITATAHRSTDNGVTWVTGDLPDNFTGLVRWDIPLPAGAIFTGLELLPPAPVLSPIADRDATQQQTLTIPLTASWSGSATWTVAAVGVAAEIISQNLIINTAWASGDVTVTVMLRDDRGRVASQSFIVSVTPEPWSAPPVPPYPRAPIIVGDDDDAVAIIDALSAVASEEVNGENTLEFSIPVNHRHADLIVSEARVEAATELYRIRRVTTERKGRAPVYKIYCEALFYDLAYAGQIEPREYSQIPPGVAIADALQGTGWSIGKITVTTRRTYSIDEATNPLALLRLVAQQHGGDLVFDNRLRTVSLVTKSGLDQGVAFFYGKNLTSSKRVVDSTSLVTRLYARNADGLTIAEVNDGKPYLEDFSWTEEVREATYDFAAGVSPWTMLSMSQATLANRSKPSYSYEFAVADLSSTTGQEIDRFDVGDTVTVVDDELGIRSTQRIIRVEHDLVRPTSSKVTLSAKLRESGSSSAGQAAALGTGSQFATFDLVPFNLLKNGRFDNGFAHWAASGAVIVSGEGTGDFAVRLQGAGVRWFEQTVVPDNRDSYTLSLRADAVSGGAVPNLTAIVTVEYEDGETDSIPIELV